MIAYSGTTDRLGGTIIVPSAIPNSALRPAKRSLANAKPASVQSRHVLAVTTVQTISELTSASPMACCCTALTTLAHRSGPGSTGGGDTFISAIGRLAATSM